MGSAMNGGGFMTGQTGVLPDIPALRLRRRGRRLPACGESVRSEHDQADRDPGGHQGRGSELTEYGVAVHNEAPWTMGRLDDRERGGWSDRRSPFIAQPP